MYIPVIAMLLCLIFRGVAFEFRFKADKSRILWDYAFHFGSLGAALMQGMILGGIVQGITVEGRGFSGGAFDWLTAFSFMTALGVVCGYILLGATWLILKTDGDTQKWARRTAKYILLFVMIFLGLVSLWVPYLDNNIHQRWFGDLFIWLLPVPVITAAIFGVLIYSLKTNKEFLPFLCSALIFIMGFIGLALSLWPYAVPHTITIWDAAAAHESLSLMLVGVVIMLPIILAYTAYCYYIFRGKVSAEHTY